MGDFLPLLRSFSDISMGVLRGFAVVTFCLNIQEGWLSKIQKLFYFIPYSSLGKTCIQWSKSSKLVSFRGIPRKVAILPLFDHFRAKVPNSAKCPGPKYPKLTLFRGPKPYCNGRGQESSPFLSKKITKNNDIFVIFCSKDPSGAQINGRNVLILVNFRHFWWWVHPLFGPISHTFAIHPQTAILGPTDGHPGTHRRASWDPWNPERAQYMPM